MLLNRLGPDVSFIKKVSDALENLNPKFDRLDEFVDLLNHELSKQDLLIEVDYNKTGNDAVDWYIESAMTFNDGFIIVHLHPESIEYDWDYSRFKSVFIKTLEHESLHLEQMKKMGHLKFILNESGYQKGLKLFDKTNDMNDLKRLYFKDPLELIAHGHDLFREISTLECPDKVLRSIEYYVDELPTYQKYRQLFPKSSKTIKKLLSYTYGYMKSY